MKTLEHFGVRTDLRQVDDALAEDGLEFGGVLGQLFAHQTGRVETALRLLHGQQHVQVGRTTPGRPRWRPPAVRRRLPCFARALSVRDGNPNMFS